MFTGLVEDVGTVVTVQPQGKGTRLGIRTRIPLAEVALGDSIAVNGVCLTAESCTADIFEAVAGRETVLKTNIGHLRAGDTVHLERALRVGDRLGGHLVQGHVDGTARIVRRSQESETFVLWVELQPAQSKYAVAKGSITIDGVSLTINELSGHAVRLNIVPHTWNETRLGGLQVGDLVNIEVDVLAKYVERLLGGGQGSGLTLDTLKKWGY